MKVMDKLISFIFDVVIIVMTVAILLTKFNVIQDEVLLGLLNDYVFNPQYDLIVIFSCIAILLLAFKVTVFTSSFSKKARKNILVDTEHGKIQIAQTTIENIARNTVKEYPQLKDVQAVMTRAKKGINLYMSLVAFQGVNIKDIVTKVQSDVKKQIESTTGIIVCNIDVKIKNVVKVDAAYKNDNVKEEVAVTEQVNNSKIESVEEKISETTENVKDEQNQ